MHPVTCSYECCSVGAWYSSSPSQHTQFESNEYPKPLRSYAGDSKMACKLMPSFRCTMWIQNMGGGSAHVSCGVPDHIPANRAPMRVPDPDLTSLGMTWPPPPGSHQDHNLRNACQPLGGRCQLVLTMRSLVAPAECLERFEKSRLF